MILSGTERDSQVNRLSYCAVSLEKKEEKAKEKKEEVIKNLQEKREKLQKILWQNKSYHSSRIDRYFLENIFKEMDVLEKEYREALYEEKKYRYHRKVILKTLAKLQDEEERKREVI